MGAIEEPMYKIGHWYYTGVEHKSDTDTFPIGTLVQVVGYGLNGYAIRDEIGILMVEVGWDL